MSREWKPGDVAMVVNTARENKVARFTGRWGEVGLNHWSFADGSTLLPREVSVARPLAVIDPEDREAVARLLGVTDVQQWSGHISDMQAALREFADPKPPKPDEPMGLGAVVEDAKGTLWVRLHNYQGDAWKPYDRRDPVYRRTWAGVAAVRVLSEGIDA